MTSPIDLSLLPAPQVVEVLDFEAIYAMRVQAVLDLLPDDVREQAAAILALESEPATKLLQENAYRELIIRNRINDAAKAIMLAFARGTDLAHIGANSNVARLVVVAADPDAMPPVAQLDEVDEAYRLRIQEAPDALSVAGPRNAYEFFARSADGQVKDARAISPAACEIVVAVLSAEDNGLASAELLQSVAQALSAEEVRPLGDLVTVQQAEVIEYTVDAILYVEKGPEAEIARKAAAVNAKRLSTPLRPLGYSIYQAAYITALKVEGVRNVKLLQPTADIVLSRTQAARCLSIDIRVEVLEEAADA